MVNHPIAWLAALLASAGAAAEPQASPSRPVFQVPPGFVVEKIAGPPLVRYPLFAAFDDRGRLFVAEGTGTNLPGEELARRKLGRIIVLEDTDGDGRFDTCKVFADKLVFPQGVLWHDGAIYSASHPSLWRFEEPRDGAQADRGVELLRGFRFNGNGCDVHGPFLGPDGRLYWTDGRHGYDIRTRDGRHLQGFAARVWRSRLDGTDAERLCGGGFDNPIEIAFTPDGEAIGTMDQGTGDALLHYVDGGVYAMEHPCLNEFVRTGPLLEAIRAYTADLPPALCGLSRYRSASFGKEFENSFFATQYLLHKIVRYPLIRKGSTFQAEERDFLTSDNHDVHITDVLEDADGSLLFVDMGGWFTYGFLGSPLPKPEILGAIYRIRRVGAPAVSDPWGKRLQLATRSLAELALLLDDPRPKVRDQAIDHLVRHRVLAIPTLEAVLRARAERSAEARRNAVWALCRLEVPQTFGALRHGLTDPDASVRMAAVHALGLHRDAQAADMLGHRVVSDVPSVRRKAAEALGRIGAASSVPALIKSLHGENDRFLEHALTYALIRINNPEAILPVLETPNPRVRRAALIALDQMPAGNLRAELVAPLLQADDTDLQHAALGVISKRPGWSGMVLNLLQRWLQSKALAPAQERALSEAVLALCTERNVQDLVGNALVDTHTPSATRGILLRTIGQCRLETLPASWLHALDRLLSESEPDVFREAVMCIKSRNVVSLDDRLALLASDKQLPVDLRIGILEYLIPRRKAVDAQAFIVLATHLDDSRDPLLRIAAARALGSATLDAGQLQRLARALPSASTLHVRLLLPAFGKNGDASVGRALIGTLQCAPGAESLRPAELDSALKNQPVDIRASAASLRARLVDRQKGQAAFLIRLKEELAQLHGDPDAGLNVFFSPKVGCYACHHVIGKGGRVGPELSHIGRLRTEAELLESIVFPSVTIAPEFRAYQVALKNGQVHTGLVVAESSSALTLRTAQLAEMRLLRKEIDEMSPSDVSLMPEGLEKTMSRQELRDLLEFLVRQK